MGIPGSASQHATSYDIDLMPFEKMLDYVAMIKYRKDLSTYHDGTSRHQYKFNCFVIQKFDEYLHPLFINLKKCLDQKKGQGSHFCVLVYVYSHWFLLDFIITDDFKLKILFIDAFDRHRKARDIRDAIDYENQILPKNIIRSLFTNYISGIYIKDIFFWFPRMQITHAGCGIFVLDLAIQLTKMHLNHDNSFYDAFEKSKASLFANNFNELTYYVLDNCTSIYIPPALLRMHQVYSELDNILKVQKGYHPTYSEIEVSRKSARSTLGTYRGKRVRLGSSYKNIALTQKFTRLKEKLYDFEIKTFPATRADKIIAGYKKEIETGEDFFRDLGVG